MLRDRRKSTACRQRNKSIDACFVSRPGIQITIHMYHLNETALYILLFVVFVAMRIYNLVLKYRNNVLYNNRSW